MRDCLAGLVDQIGAKDLTLTHRQSTGKLRQILAESGLNQERFKLAKSIGGVKAGGPAVHFVQRADIGRRPGKTMGSSLFPIKGFRVAGTELFLELPAK